MRFMVMIKANRDTEAGVMPGADVLAAMGRYNEELVEAGVMLGGEGLHPSSRGARVRFSEGQPLVVNGPFAETRELIAGYWLFQTGSLQEAIDWVKRCPASAVGDAEIEIRQIFEADDFGAEFTPELREQEERLRARITS
ncbi:YciI family protein [Pseudomonas sp.]|uniref:YciI family protein n=1 Tax=Pseudomonas sp. TaxID=306 RepID=UPI0028A93E3D|nr:YciI family protein [Pseudomonas sp.]